MTTEPGAGPGQRFAGSERVSRCPPRYRDRLRGESIDGRRCCRRRHRLRYPVLRMGRRPVPRAVGAVPRDRSAGPARVAVAGRLAATPV